MNSEIVETKYIWLVAKNGLVPVRKYEVAKETPKTYVLDDGTVVRKETMQNNYLLFFLDEDEANKVYLSLRAVFDNGDEGSTHFDTITKCTSTRRLSAILFNMIQELCEDGMPTHEEIERWLKK